MDWARLNPEVIAEFRANGGRVKMFGDQPVVVLHTKGARTGRLLEVPLVAVPTGERLLVFGSAAGSKETPAWVFNLRAHPRVEVELGTERFEADLIEFEPEARRARVEAMAAAEPRFASYVSKAAPREIPVFEIRRAG